MRSRTIHFLCALLIGALFSSAVSAARIPMYQAYSSSLQDFFYMTSAAERDQAVVQYGYVDNGVAFYVDDGSTPGVVPYYRFWKGDPQYDHFYTSDSNEVGIVQSYGWVYEGVQGYVFNYGAAGTVPVYRLSYYNGANGDLMHYYTQSYSQAVQMTGQGWGLDTHFYAFNSAEPPAVQPTMVHATHLTASCADKYCVKITGYNFAANSYVEMRQTSASGPVIGYVYDFVRGSSGDAQTIEITFAPGSPYRGQIDHPAGIWFWVINPGNPSARGGGFNVIRDSQYSLWGWVDGWDQVGMSGWICTDRDVAAGVQYTVRDGSDSGEIVATGVANGGPRSDVAQVCGGNGMHSFQVFWPSKWRDGVARHAYLVGNFAPGGSYRYPNALVPNSPTLVQLAYSPWDAIATPSVQTITVARGGSFSATFGFTNKGSATWDTNVSVAQTGTVVPWMIDSLGLGANIPPDGTRTYTIGGAAPTTAGSYVVRYRVRQRGAFFGTAAFIYVNVQP